MSGRPDFLKYTNYVIISNLITSVTPKTSSEVFTQYKPIGLGKYCKLPTKEIEDFNSNMRQKLKKTGFLEYFEKDQVYPDTGVQIVNPFRRGLVLDANGMRRSETKEP